jgi:hypothetical protein
MIPEWWPIVVFGLPGLLASLIVSGLGIVLDRPIFLCFGALLAIPSAHYLGGHPGWWPALFVLPALHVVAAVAVRSRSRLVAAGVLLPNVGLAVLLAVIMLRNLRA